MLVDMNWVEFQRFSLLGCSEYLLMEKSKYSGFKGLRHNKGTSRNEVGAEDETKTEKT